MAHDILSGIPALAFIKKYEISAYQLRSILRKLVEGDFLSHEELRCWNENSLGHKQILARCYPLFRIDVCELGNPRNVGAILDIDECGLGAAGLHADIGATKSYAVLGDEFGRVDPFEFDARCLWVRNRGANGSQASGFEIARISTQDLRLLRRLLCLAAGVGSGHSEDSD